MAKVVFTAGRVKNFKCPPDKAQAFLWDSTAKGLGLRATPSGNPSYVFQAVYRSKDIRLTIGSPDVWTIPLAQEKARELQRLIDEGRDPREVIAEKTATDVTKRENKKTLTLTLGEVWALYLAERKQLWGTRHYRDHTEKAAPGGEPFKRGQGVTEPGPLYPLMALPLRDLTAPVIEAWAASEGKIRPTSARLSWRLLKGFINWCNEQPAYASLMTGNPAKTKKIREALGKPTVKTDVLQKGQLAAWFSAMLQIQNPAISAYCGRQREYVGI